MKSTSELPSLRRRIFLVGLFVFFIGLAVQYSFKVIHHGAGSSAFNRWRSQVLALEAGEDAYQKFSYPNPPMMAMILLPFYQLPELPSAMAWYAFKMLLGIASLLLVFRLVEEPEHPFPEWCKALVVLLSIKPIMGDLSHGNVNLLILFLVVAALFAYRRGLDVRAGICLALAIVCKVTPALFVPYFLWKRAWRTLAGCAFGLVLFYIVVPGLWFGQARNVALLKSWSNGMIRPFVVDGKVAYSEHPNQSLPGLIYRLTTHSPSFSEFIDNKVFHPLQYHNFLSLSPAEARLLILGCAGLFAVLVPLVCRTPPSERRGWRLPAEFSIILLGMLLLSERTWKHHCPILVVPFAVLCYQLTRAAEWKRRWFLIGTLAVSALLMSATTMPGIERWDAAARLAQVYGAYVWAFLVLLSSLSYLLCRRDAPASIETETLPLPAPLVLKMADRGVRVAD